LEIRIQQRTRWCVTWEVGGLVHSRELVTYECDQEKEYVHFGKIKGVWLGERGGGGVLKRQEEAWTKVIPVGFSLWTVGEGSLEGQGGLWGGRPEAADFARRKRKEDR